MKKEFTLTAMLLFCLFFASGVIAAPSYSAPESVNIVAGSGNNQIILSDVTEISSFGNVTVTGGDATIVETPTVAYTPEQRFAILNVKETGKTGTVKLQATAGGINKEITVNVVVAHQTGIAAELYDVAFWENANPITSNGSPIFSIVQANAEFPTRTSTFWSSIWELIKPGWTINSSSIDGGTTGLKGFFIAPTTGNYTFTLVSDKIASGALYFDATATSWRDAAIIAGSGIGTSVTVSGRGARRAASIALEAGMAYPIYMLNWDYSPPYSDIRVSGPEIEEKIIDGDMLAPLADNVKPNAPQNVTVSSILDTKVLLEWDATAGDKKIAKVKGYNVYVNGTKNNPEPIASPIYMVTDLLADTQYDLFVTAVDELGNESLISNFVSPTTAATTAATPSAPENITALGTTGTSIKLTWDKGTNVAFDVYVDNEKTNADYIFSDTFFIRDLQPETAYSVQVKGYNSSLIGTLSPAVPITTAAFDPTDELGIEYNEYRVRLNIEPRNITWTEGVGVNASVQNGNLISNSTQKKRADELNPGVIRWGELGANTKTFEGSIGNQNGTHAKTMNYSNQVGAYYALCIGTRADSDYMTEPLTFLRLIEYLAGPADSEYGQIRANEGFSEPLLKKGTSKGLLLEFGNEVWGGSSHNAPIGANYENYAAWCRQMADTIRTSPYWEDIKDIVYMVYSGRDPSIGSENMAVIRGDNGKINTLGVSGYLGGNMNYNPEVDYGQSIAEYYRLRQQHMKSNLSGLQALMRFELLENQQTMYSFLYETQVSMASYFGNLGQGVVLNDYMWSSMKYGSIVPAIFHLSDGSQWRTFMHSGEPLAHYTIARLSNTYCKGHVLETSVETNNTLWIDENQQQPLLDHDPVGASAYNNGNRWSILLFSRDFDNDYTVQLNLPDNIGEITNAKKFQVTGDGTENGPSIRASFKSDSIVSGFTIKDGMLVTVPKYSMVLLTFEANDPGFEAHPLGHFERVKPQTLEFEGNPQITQNGGNTRITGIVKPEDAFSKGILWEFSESNNPHATGMPFPTIAASTDYAIIRANRGSTCNGSLWLKGTLVDNLEVSSSIEITFTNQTANCEYPFNASESAENQASIAIYPTIAKELLYVKAQSGIATITIYNSIGVRVMAETALSELTELNISSLTAGKYLVSVESNGVTEVASFVKR